MNKPRLNPSIEDKTVISFLITPAIPTSIYSAYSLIDNPRASMLAIGIIFVFVYLVASAHSFLLGIPAFLIGKWLNVIHWWTCLLVGFLIGSVPIALWSRWSEVISWGLFGASGGFTFWLLWHFWIRLDQQAKT